MMTLDIRRFLEWLGYDWTVVLLTGLTAAGLAMAWIGALVALLTALGRRQWWWAAALLLTGPLAAIPYGLRYRVEGTYPLRLCVGGLLLVLPLALFVLYALVSR
ncbi:MAG: hypothetical protein AABZ50_03135 [Pseudomonadota bacterium]